MKTADTYEQAIQRARKRSKRDKESITVYADNDGGFYALSETDYLIGDYDLKPMVIIDNGEGID